MPDRSTLGSIVSERLAPVSMVPVRSIPEMSTPVSIVPVRSIPDRSTPIRFALERSAPVSIVPVRSWPDKLIEDKFVLVKFTLEIFAVSKLDHLKSELLKLIYSKFSPLKSWNLNSIFGISGWSILQFSSLIKVRAVLG